MKIRDNLGHNKQNKHNIFLKKPLPHSLHKPFKLAINNDSKGKGKHDTD